MIRWLITILVRMAPDHKSPNAPIQSAEEDKLTGLGSAILKESTSESIVERCTMLFNWLRSLTDLIVACCKDLSGGGKPTNVDDGDGAPVGFEDLPSLGVVEEISSDSAKDAQNLEVHICFIYYIILKEHITGMSELVRIVHHC